MRFGCLSIVVAILLAVILPWVFADMLATALVKLHLSPQTAGMVVFAIIAGSLVNIPIKRIARTDVMAFDPMAVFGLHGLWPEMRRVRTETIVAVNVGGCVIPVGLAIYEMVGLASQGGALAAIVGAAGVNIAVCYRLAKPVEGVGIMMPAMIPAAVACAMAIMLAPAIATPSRSSRASRGR